ACDLTFDPNTAHTQLMLSDENRKVMHVLEDQPYPDHPERFDEYPQVLCVESLTGRCYWETELSGDAEISLTYKGINRRGGEEDCAFGFNDKSWNLDWSEDRIIICHNINYIEIPAWFSASNR
ncbi:hypothetical protein M9458_000271, partial [Cirrhinus mrigala]